MADDWLWEYNTCAPRSPEKLAALRASSLANYEKLGMEPITSFTCDNCDKRFTCTAVFEAWNQDGNCILEDATRDEQT
jgi:hypothetical protein